MTTSLVSCANTGISLLDDPLNEPTVTDVYSSHQPTCLLAPQIPTSAASRTSSCPTTASSVTEGQALDSSMSMKDML